MSSEMSSPHGGCLLRSSTSHTTSDGGCSRSSARTWSSSASAAGACSAGSSPWYSSFISTGKRLPQPSGSSRALIVEKSAWKKSPVPTSHMLLRTLSPTDTRGNLAEEDDVVHVDGA